MIENEILIFILNNIERRIVLTKKEIKRNCHVYVCEFLMLLSRIFVVDVHVIFFHVQYDEFLKERNKRVSLRFHHLPRKASLAS